MSRQCATPKQQTVPRTQTMTLAKAVGACLVILFAVSAAAASSASAQAPEYGRCLKAGKVGKVYDGEFENSGCTKKSAAKTGKFEWHPGVVKAGQTTVNTTGATLETVNKLGYHCTSESSTGEYSGTKEVKNIILKFKGCESGGFVCTSPGHEAGELETKTLEGVVEFEEGGKTKLKTVFDLSPVGKTGLLIEFTCTDISAVKWEGSILVPVTPNKMLLEDEMKYISKKGHQKPEEYENAAGEVLKDVLTQEFVEKGKGLEQMGWNLTTKLKNEEKLELNAVV
jgi:hypothetical protein